MKKINKQLRELEAAATGEGAQHIEEKIESFKKEIKPVLIHPHRTEKMV